MGKEIITFNDSEVEKHEFYQHKSAILIYDVDNNKVMVSSKFSFGIKVLPYFIGYKDD